MGLSRALPVVSILSLGALASGCGGTTVPKGPGSSISPSRSSLDSPSSSSPSKGSGFAAALAESEANKPPSSSTTPSTRTTPTAPPTTTPPTNPTPTGSREWLPGKYMAEAVAHVAGNAHKLEQGSTYGFSVEHSSILGAFVRAGQNVRMRQTFSKEYEYVLLGGGSSGAQDVDLAIVDANGLPAAADISSDPTPVVKFRPKTTGMYEIRLVLARTQLAGNFVAVATMREGGYAIPKENIVSSFSKALSGAQRIAQHSLIQQRGGLSFHESKNWSFYATVLKAREKTSFSGLTLTRSPTIVLAGADSRASNIDLMVEDTTTSTMVGKDDGPDATPLILLNTVDATHSYRVHVQNSASSGPSLVTMLVLDTGTSAGGGSPTVLASPE